MTDQQQSAAVGERSDHALGRWLRERLPTGATVREFVILFAVTTFLLLYGLVPTFGGHAHFPSGQLDELLAGLGDVIDAVGGSFTMAYTSLAISAQRDGDG